MRRFSINGRMVLVAVLALSLLGNALAIGAGLRLLRLRADLLGDQAYAGLQEPEVRRALNAALVAHRDTIAPALRAVLRARMAAMETGSAEPFDRQATLDRMADTRLAIDQLLDAVQIALLDGLETHAGVSPEAAGNGGSTERP